MSKNLLLAVIVPSILLLPMSSFAASRTVKVWSLEAFRTDLEDFRPGVKVFTDREGHIIVVAPKEVTLTEDHVRLEADKRALSVEKASEFYAKNPNVKPPTLFVSLRDHIFFGGIDSLDQVNRYGNDRSHREVFELQPSSIFSGYQDLTGVKCGDRVVPYFPVDEETVQRVRTHAEFKPFSLEVREPEYLFRFKKDNRFAYVDRNPYHVYHFRLYIGVPGAMVDQSVTDVVRYRDGGSTYVKAELGKLEAPYGEVPVWFEDYSKKKAAELERIKLEPTTDFSFLGIPGVSRIEGIPEIVTPCDHLRLAQ